MEIQTAIPVVWLFYIDPLKIHFILNTGKSEHILVTWITILCSVPAVKELQYHVALNNLHSKWEQKVVGKKYIPFGMFSS